jgi:hypothetical protein
VNVRFSEGAVRCRVTKEEFEQLLGSGTLKLVVELPRSHTLQVTVRAAVFGPWLVESDPTGIWIGIPRAELQQLAQALPSREGITHAFVLDAAQPLQVSFEVDVRKRRRSA